MVTHDPLHGSGRAELPHPALASGDDAEAAQRCRPPDVSAPAHCARPTGAESGARFAGAGSPWPVPFPPSPPPPTLVRLCSETSQVLRNCPTSHARSSSAYVLRLSRHGLRLHQPQAGMGSPGSRARCFRTCSGSLTARDPPASRDSDARAVAFRLVPRRRPLEGRLFRGSIALPARAPVNASAPPYGVHRMTRGRRGSLALRRVALSSTTPRRFIPGHGTPARTCALAPTPCAPPQELSRTEVKAKTLITNGGIWLR